MPPDVPPVLLKWAEFIRWLLPHTAQFPKHLRFSVAHRLDDKALDIHERLIEARYNWDRDRALRRANIDLDILRMLLRIAYDLKALSPSAFEHACAEVESTGRMVGGWMRSGPRQVGDASATPGRPQ